MEKHFITIQSAPEKQQPHIAFSSILWDVLVPVSLFVGFPCFLVVLKRSVRPPLHLVGLYILLVNIISGCVECCGIGVVYIFYVVQRFTQQNGNATRVIRFLENLFGVGTLASFLMFELIYVFPQASKFQKRLTVFVVFI